jgi:peptide chain release factor 2
MEAMDGFWNDAENSAKLLKEKSVIQESVNTYKELADALDEFDILYNYASEGDQDSAQEALSIYDQCAKALAEAEKKALLSDPMDPNNAIVSINAGAGGTESCDWAAMLHRMITRYCEQKKFKVNVLDFQYGDSAGIKSVTMMVEGNFAFGMLKSESGIHRLVRISPFDSNARRHTSFASIYVSPEVDDSIEIEVLDKDLRIDVYRSGGAGGQSVNTTDSAVRMTHIPTNTVVTCQNERSQLQNKITAMKILKSKLYELEMEKRRAEQDKVNAEKKEIGWGSQIRSYVLHPYKLVKDHRNDFQSSNPDAILDGELDDFVKSFLQWRATEV